MPPRVKQEPGSGSRANRRLVAPESVMDAQSETPSEQVQRLRQVRSAAPSIDTRARPSTVFGAQEIEDDDDDDDEPVIMQVRRNPKVEQQEAETIMGSQSMHGSFIGPNRALRDIGQKLKDINDTLGELQARGIQHVASLPELVLVGDQSSGKSSLMSAIAGLSLPRSSGVCTRCPIHIRVSRADEWSCRVFLKQDYDFCPPNHPITERDVTKAHPYPPWVKLDPSRQARWEFKTVRDQFDSEEIETVLRCAQIAILNPSTHHQSFIPKLKGEATEDTRQKHLEWIQRSEERAEAQFSPNTVALEVRGPDLADLNFYDLPGVFMTAARAEDSFLERVVVNLTREYIARESAIIMCCVPMNQDTENSLALKLIRDLRAGNRCIGVMTKADLLPRDNHAFHNWLAMLNGRAHRTGYGYFITSRQGSDLEEQNKMEEAFFNRTADATGQWPEAFDSFKDRWGVEKLKAFLSLKLGEEFAKILPEVKHKVNSRVEDINEQLKKYPDPPPNSELEIMNSLAEFTSGVRTRVTQQEFMSSWDAVVRAPFKKHIIDLKPKFNVREHAKAVVIDLDSDSPHSAATPSARKRSAPVDLTQSIPKRSRGQQTNGAVKAETPDHPNWPPTTPRHPRSATPANGMTPSRGSRSKSLVDLRHLIKRHAIPGQPGLVSASVHEPLYIEVARTWARHLDSFIENTFTFLRREIFAILESAFSHLKNRAVYKESRTQMNAFIETHKAELSQQLHLIYSLESSRLFTTDERSLERNKSDEMKILVRHRNHFRIAAHNGEELNSVPKLEEMTDEERRQEESRMAKDLRALGPDPFEPELAVAAYIRGYYLTAANRFVDTVAIHIMAGLLPRVASAIKTYLHEKLGLLSNPYSNPSVSVSLSPSPNPDGSTNNPNNNNDTLTALTNHAAVLARLMSEGPEIEQKRRDLRAEKATLDGAMDIIVALERREREQAAAGASQYGGLGGGGGGGGDASSSEMLLLSQGEGGSVGGGGGGSMGGLDGVGGVNGNGGGVGGNGLGHGNGDGAGTVYSATAFGDA